jgi:WD40 repeat protein
MNIADNKENEFKFEFKSPLLSPPKIFNDFFVFYPKSFGGTIYLTDNEGKIRSGWENNDAGGIGYGTPAVSDINDDGLEEIIFISQSGNLNIWSVEGKMLDKFPLKLENVFYVQPETGALGLNGKKTIVCLGKDGTLYLLSPDGHMELEKRIKDADSKDRKLMLFDVNKDGLEEIIIYGATNNLMCLDNKGNQLPGFPVKGSFKPDFSDFDSDGNYEMVTASYDNNIYVYSIPRSE